MMLVTPYPANIVCKEGNLSIHAIEHESLIPEIGAAGMTFMVFDVGIWHPLELLVDVRRNILTGEPHHARADHPRIGEVVEHGEVVLELEDFIKGAGDC